MIAFTKKILMLTGAMLALGAQLATAQVAKVTLSHNGQLTLFNAEQLAQAIEASVDGDTIYLNEGTFAGNITIPKAISIIGAGENTIVNGGVSITYEGTLKARILDALNIKNAISAGAQTGLVIRKCKFSSFTAGALKDAMIDRCYCTSKCFFLNASMSNVQVVNSVIYMPDGNASNVGDVVFVNCNILDFWGYDNVKATFLNCVVHNYYLQPESYFSYCRLHKDNGTNTMQNCSVGTFSWSYTYDYSGGGTGSDGTSYGITGGTTPFTLVPSNPKVSSYSLNVDAANKKLNVNVSVKAQ